MSSTIYGIVNTYAFMQGQRVILGLMVQLECQATTGAKVRLLCMYYVYMSCLLFLFNVFSISFTVELVV